MNDAEVPAKRRCVMNAAAVDASTLDELLSEPIGSVLQREQTEFDRLTGPFGNALVLFGAGNLGRIIQTKLQPLGIEPLAFTDNNPKLWGTTVEGIPVFSPAAAAARFGSSATFIVTIWGVGSQDRMRSRVKQLRELGCRNVIPFAALFWKYADLFLPYHVIDRPYKVASEASSVQAASRLWADDFSRREYIAQVKWRLYGDFDSMADPVDDAIYFPNELFTLTSQEVFVDCGAFDGDTVAAFLQATNSRFERVVAFEPDPANFAGLQNFVETLDPAERERIITLQNAVGKSACKVRFAAAGTDGSAIDAGGDMEVACVALDQVLEDIAPTHIKMDIEGAELDGLAGGRGLIERHTPILAICSYHRQSDLWRIPLLIHTMYPDYRMYLRPYRIEGWDVVCYAVPPGRTVMNA